MLVEAANGYEYNRRSKRDMPGIIKGYELLGRSSNSSNPECSSRQCSTGTYRELLRITGYMNNSKNKNSNVNVYVSMGYGNDRLGSKRAAGVREGVRAGVVECVDLTLLPANDTIDADADAIVVFALAFVSNFKDLHDARRSR
ncbi:GH14001 [Drosophila grimshawi]|uniref:GH14001 n=1 Tax=Drosophila grimshawi TaxID=7222 RepID=B4JYJ7_DROGR|nr:GH14001 [Drosophila grimshawi]